jgi:group I intron endonuclease
MNYTNAGWVYAITNTVNNKQYIGSTRVTPSKRKNVHFSRLRRGVHHSYKLQSGWNAFGERSFRFDVLLVCPADMVIYYENLLLPTASYNIVEAGQNLASARWRGHVKQVRVARSRSDARKASWQNPLHRANRIAGLIRAAKTPEARAKRKAASLGRRHTEKTRATIAAKKHKRVYCPELEVTFFSGKAAAEFFGVCRSAVSNAVRCGSKIASTYALTPVV